MLAVTVFGTAACVAICLSWRRQRDWTRVEHTLATRTGRDPLTGLVDRVGLTERLSKGLGPQRTPTASRPAVLCCDLDRFQRINDTYGHAAATACIVAAGRRFANVLRAGDTIGRLDGDTFVVICLVGSANEATEIADRLLGTLENPFAIGGHTFRVTASIGVAVADGSTADPEALMRDADHAMIQAKRDGRERAVLFASDMRPRTSVGTHRAAASSARTRPVPTRVPAGRVELRRHDRRRRSPAAVGPPAPRARMPNEFIPQLEESGLIVEVGTWVLREACRQASEWMHAFPDLGVRVDGQRVRPSAGRARLPLDGGVSALHGRAAPGAALSRADRGNPAARHGDRLGTAACGEAARRTTRARRLRHRVLVAQLRASVRGRHDQDRPLLRAGRDDECGGPRHRRRGRGLRQRPRHRAASPKASRRGSRRSSCVPSDVACCRDTSRQSSRGPRAITAMLAAAT